MTPCQVRDRIRELEEKFLRIKEELFQVANTQQGAPWDKGESATSGETGEIREGLARDG